jgi:hypothetical protein
LLILVVFACRKTSHEVIDLTGDSDDERPRKRLRGELESPVISGQYHESSPPTPLSHGTNHQSRICYSGQLISSPNKLSFNPDAAASGNANEMATQNPRLLSQSVHLDARNTIQTYSNQRLNRKDADGRTDIDALLEDSDSENSDDDMLIAIDGRVTITNLLRKVRKQTPGSPTPLSLPSPPRINSDVQKSSSEALQSHNSSRSASVAELEDETPIKSISTSIGPCYVVPSSHSTPVNDLAHSGNHGSPRFASTKSLQILDDQLTLNRPVNALSQAIDCINRSPSWVGGLASDLSLTYPTGGLLTAATPRSFASNPQRKLNASTSLHSSNKSQTLPNKPKPSTPSKPSLTASRTLPYGGLSAISKKLPESSILRPQSSIALLDQNSDSSRTDYVGNFQGNNTVYTSTRTNCAIEQPNTGLNTKSIVLNYHINMTNTSSRNNLNTTSQKMLILQAFNRKALPSQRKILPLSHPTQKFPNPEAPALYQRRRFEPSKTSTISSPPAALVFNKLVPNRPILRSYPPRPTEIAPSGELMIRHFAIHPIFHKSRYPIPVYNGAKGSRRSFTPAENVILIYLKEECGYEGNDMDEKFGRDYWRAEGLLRPKSSSTTFSKWFQSLRYPDKRDQYRLKWSLGALREILKLDWEINKTRDALDQFMVNGQLPSGLNLPSNEELPEPTIHDVASNATPPIRQNAASRPATNLNPRPRPDYSNLLPQPAPDVNMLDVNSLNANASHELGTTQISLRDAQNYPSPTSTASDRFEAYRQVEDRPKRKQ